eukprot:gene11288-biopygen12388
MWIRQDAFLWSVGQQEAMVGGPCLLEVYEGSLLHWFIAPVPAWHRNPIPPAHGPRSAKRAHAEAHRRGPPPRHIEAGPRRATSKRALAEAHRSGPSPRYIEAGPRRGTSKRALAEVHREGEPRLRRRRPVDDEPKEEVGEAGRRDERDEPRAQPREAGHRRPHPGRRHRVPRPADQHQHAHQPRRHPGDLEEEGVEEEAGGRDAERVGQRPGREGQLRPPAQRLAAAPAEQRRAPAGAVRPAGAAPSATRRSQENRPNPRNRALTFLPCGAGSSRDRFLSRRCPKWQGTQRAPAAALWSAPPAGGAAPLPYPSRRGIPLVCFQMHCGHHDGQWVPVCQDEASYEHDPV